MFTQCGGTSQSLFYCLSTWSRSCRLTQVAQRTECWKESKKHVQLIHIWPQQIEKLNKKQTELLPKCYFVLCCTSIQKRVNDNNNNNKKIWNFSPDNLQNKEAQLFGPQKHDFSQISFVCKRVKTSYSTSVYQNTNDFSYISMKALNWSQTVCLWTSVLDWSIHWNASWETR